MHRGYTQTGRARPSPREITPCRQEKRQKGNGEEEVWAGGHTAGSTTMSPASLADAPATKPQRLSAIIHSSTLHYALLSSLFSWLKPQVKNKTMFLLKNLAFKKIFYFFYFLSFGKHLQLTEHCWGGAWQQCCQLAPHQRVSGHNG